MMTRQHSESKGKANTSDCLMPLSQKSFLLPMKKCQLLISGLVWLRELLSKLICFMSAPIQVLVTDYL